MVEFTNPPNGPGRIIDRRGQPEPSGAPQPLHPFSPRVWWQGEQGRMAEKAGNREAFTAGGWKEGSFPGGEYGPAPRPENRGANSSLDGLLTSIFDRLSRQVAGGTRMDPRDLLPEVNDPLEGVIPDEFLPDVETADWFDPADWANNPEDVDVDITPATGAGKDGDGLDWFRGGQAPNNYVNRNNPLYQARRDFAVNMTPRIEQMFGVSAEGSAGYMRAPSSGDAAPGGRAANSDHYSGGAVDFFGTPEELTALRNWLVNQDYTSFVRWQSESHYDHVHVSFDIGWIAQNYMQGRTLPPVQRSAAIPGAPESARKSGSAATVARKRPQSPVQVADDPTLNRAI